MGLVLENFDAVGRWRTREEGGDVDAGGELADGTMVNGPVALREVLARKPQQFARIVTEKLMTYTLGRGLEYFDMPTVRAIVNDAASDDYRFSTLVFGLVNGDQFRIKMVRDDDELAVTTAAAVDE